MAACAAFADVLDEKLDGDRAGEPGPETRACWSPPNPPYWFVAPEAPRASAGDPIPRGTAIGPDPRGATTGRAPHSGTDRAARARAGECPWQTHIIRPAAAVPPRPRRRLSPRQRQALDVLNRLGGTLGEDFSDVELRRAFRTLARRYHPDGHPDACEAEKAALAQRFAEMYDAYRLLH